METQKTATAKPVAKKQRTMFEDLLAIQQSLQTVVKDKKAFKGTYATIENIWESIRKVVNDNGFVVIHQSTMKNEKNGMLTTARHISGELLDSFVEYSTNSDPQERGKEMTYYKRYNINAIFNVIVADEDNDANRQLGNYAKSNVDGSLAADKLLKAESRDEALKIYKGLSEAERRTTEVIAANAILKDKFESTKSEQKKICA